MKTEINISFSYGGWFLLFKRIFDLPFIPFMGLILTFDDKKEYDIILENDEQQKYYTSISYSINKKQFEVNIGKTWRDKINSDHIDYLLKKFSSWERVDTTNILEFKKLMKY